VFAGAAIDKRDYGYASSSGTGSAGQSILDTPEGATLTAIRSKNGTTNTLMLSHLWMSPTHYAGGDPTDLGWQAGNNSRSINDTAKQDSDSTGSTSHIGGPHPNALPCLFADGHIQDVPYDFAYWARMWAWDNTKPFPMPK
jgi:prepilin-type processing-associated H-X9-DG protein